MIFFDFSLNFISLIFFFFFFFRLQHFKFQSRIQRLNSLDGSTRTKVNYMDSLELFWDNQGKPLSKLPSVDKTPIDLFHLKKEVMARGGHDKVTTTHPFHSLNHFLER